jgi:hypothetical protein
VSSLIASHVNYQEKRIIRAILATINLHNLNLDLKKLKKASGSTSPSSKQQIEPNAQLDDSLQQPSTLSDQLQNLLPDQSVEPFPPIPPRKSLLKPNPSGGDGNDHGENYQETISQLLDFIEGTEMVFPFDENKETSSTNSEPTTNVHTNQEESKNNNQ